MSPFTDDLSGPLHRIAGVDGELLREEVLHIQLAHGEADQRMVGGSAIGVLCRWRNFRLSLRDSRGDLG